MDFVKELREKAKAAGKTIVLCEGEDKRVVEAASVVVKEGIAKIILLGNKSEIEKFGFDIELSDIVRLTQYVDKGGTLITTEEYLKGIL